ncbi:hypothetical protein SRB5_50600 [Streptomyces sp. RB5]|uniref:DUF881 domain-containing protein n=2 Tax=Streptomyces smaragdinus TaxID=2585196 RepID=A0A7K0CQ52_9ACTN|nr:hypothetical protein [Streptomyces smaragdinus]
MPQQGPERSSARPRPDASMSLLTEIMEHSLDDGYAEAARREKTAPRSTGTRLVVAAGLMIAALIVTVAATEAHDAAPVIAEERANLIDRVEDETAEADDLHGEVDRLRQDLEDSRSKALDNEGAAALERLGLLSGAIDVEGPGVRLVVDDAETTASAGGDGPRRSTGFTDTGRLRDHDLQKVVNGLWAAGAEAVSVNGQRLTALSAIRAAGDAIVVDNRPLAPPYTLLAIGDGDRLSDTFQNGADGRYLYVLQENYGIRTSISTQDKVSLPAAAGLTVRNAQPAGPAGKVTS